MMSVVCSIILFFLFFFCVLVSFFSCGENEMIPFEPIDLRFHIIKQILWSFDDRMDNSMFLAMLCLQMGYEISPHMLFSFDITLCVCVLFRGLYNSTHTHTNTFAWENWTPATIPNEIIYVLICFFFHLNGKNPWGAHQTLVETKSRRNIEKKIGRDSMKRLCLQCRLNSTEFWTYFEWKKMRWRKKWDTIMRNRILFAAKEKERDRSNFNKIHICLLVIGISYERVN